MLAILSQLLQVSITPSSPRTRASGSSVTSNLPPELILEIIKPFTSIERFIYKRLEYTQHGTRRRTDAELLWARTTLQAACRVSRSWNKVVTPLLYKHATLATPEQVRLFFRTLRKRQCSIELVEEIILVDHRRLWRKGLFQYTDTCNRRILVQMRKDVRSILSICRGIQGFTFNYNRLSAFVSVRDAIVNNCPINPNLRYMVIDHSNIDSYDKSPLVPHLCHLESICYHYFPCLDGQYLNKFPALRSFQFAHSHCKMDPVDLTKSLAELQALRTLALYDVTFGPNSWYLDLTTALSYPQDLQCIHVVGEHGMRIMESWIRAGHLKGIQTLVLGPVDPGHDFLLTWDFPEHLTSLTILIPCAAAVGPHSATTCSSAAVISRWFKWNCRSGSAHDNLKHIEIVLVDDPGYHVPVDTATIMDQGLRPIINEIRKHCSILNVFLELRPTTVGIDNWIGDTLNRWMV
ncbi:unnamed protein product [Somion occarium]|uniref:F-box domain-containing protein n=1 Tax=Somion occarium TaxID=3059160 RepID=A0ABP1EBT8_9APHY